MNNKENTTVNNTFTVQKLTGLAVLTAIVVILQLVGSSIRFGPFSVSLVLIPIAIGAILFGPFGGAWLGFIFGVTVLASGDAAPFFVVNAPGTVLTVLLKGALAGLCAGLVYKALRHKNMLLSTVLTAAVCPIVNTGVFLIGCKLFFMDTITGWAEAAGFPSAGAYILGAFIGFNFLFEFLVNIVLSPVIIKIIRAIRSGER